MKKRLHRLAAGMIILSLCMASSAVAANTDSWKKWKDEDGIVGYERKVEGSKYVETKAEAVIDAPEEVLLEVLMDIANFPKWMYECKESKLLEETDKFHRILYYNQNIPIIGQADRWAVIKAVTTYSFTDKGASCTTSLNSIDAPYPRTDGLRMNKFNGTFELRLLGPNKTWVRYTAYSDPAGFAPAFVAKGTIRRVSFNGVKQWRERAKDPHYIKAAETGVLKPILEKALAEGKLKYYTEATVSN